MTMLATEAVDDPAALRAAMTEALVDGGYLRSPELREAIAGLAREEFVPKAKLVEVYDAHKVVITQRAEDGTALSSASAPWLVAEMIERIGISAGMRVLEVGSGGYQAALVRDLVGPTGRVITVDIDERVIAATRTGLAAAGYDDIEVVCADAHAALVPDGELDRLLVGVGAWDVPQSWVRQLAPGGRIALPLRIGNQQRVIVFDRVGDLLISREVFLAGFVKMQGKDGFTPHRIPLTDSGDVALTVDEDRPIDAVLTGLHDGQAKEAWTGAIVPFDESLEWLELWLATTLTTAHHALLTLDPDSATRLNMPRALLGMITAVYLDDSFAYLTRRPGGDRLVEIGAAGYGPHAEQLVDLLTDQVRVWDTGLRKTPAVPQITIHPAATAGLRVGAGVFTKRHSTIEVIWPQPAA